MLNKKGLQFTSTVDIVVGAIIFIFALVLFTFFSNANEITNNDAKAQEILSFEETEGNLDLLNLVSEEEIFTLITDFDNLKQNYTDDDLIGYDTYAEVYFCKNELSEKFKNIIDRDKYFFIVWDGDNAFFECYYGIGRGGSLESKEKIHIPSSDPEKTLEVMLNVYQ